MLNVEIYDQYSDVYAADGTTLLHASEGTTSLQNTVATQAEANILVSGLYDASKALGTHTDKIIKLDEGYAELKIVFADGRSLNRVIYTITR
jgi:hypothetical protein